MEVHNNPIYQHKILVTRPVEQADKLCQLIESAGASAIRLPVIKLLPVALSTNLSKQISAIADSDVVIFVSQNAVYFLNELAPSAIDLMSEKIVIAIGSATRQALLDMGLHKVEYAQDGMGSEALLQLETLGSENVKGKSIIIVRGKGGREWLKQALSMHGAVVTYLEIYRRAKPEIDPDVLKRIWQDNPPDAIVITSKEGLQNLIDMTAPTDRTILFKTPLAVISSRLQSFALEQGFSATLQVSPDANDDGLLNTLIRIFENKR